jgi:ribonuclease P protein component
VTASRKVGRAITRNRVKRGIREWFRGCRDELEPDLDIVVIARREAAALGTAEIDDDLKALMSRIEQPAGSRYRRRDGVRDRIEEERG